MLAFEPASRPGTSELAAQLQRCSPEVRSVLRTRFSLAATSLMVLGMSAAIIFLWVRTQNSIPNLGAPKKSIAVLPFENRSEDKANAYFANGIQDEILTHLSNIADLKVISRTSTRQYQSEPRNLREIAKQLGVANILEGSVQKVADQVRVNVQLINAETDSHLWADIYDRKVTDILAIESEIAKAIVASLQAKLSGREKQALAVKPTNNPEAYDAYLRGLAFEARGNSMDLTQNSAAHNAVLQSNFYFQQQTVDSIRKSISFLQEAVRLDPNYALAYAKLSQAWRQYASTFATDDISKAYDEARQAADKAVRLAPDLAEGRMAVGLLALTPDLDFASADKEFRRVLKSSPSNAAAKNALTLSLMAQGRLTEAEEACRQAISLDPLLTTLYFNLGRIMVGTGRYKEAEEALHKGLELQPNATRFHTYFAMLDILQNRPDKAMANAQLETQGFWRDYATALVQEAQRNRSAVDAALMDFITKYSKITPLGDSFQIAVLYAIRKEPDAMFKWLDTAYATHDSGLTQLAVTPFFLPYHNDPRLIALCQKLNVQLPAASANP